MNMKKSVVLKELRSLLARQTDRERLHFTGFDPGLPKGAITQISGIKKTEWLLKLIAEHQTMRIAWIEETFSINPFGFTQRNVDLGRVLFVEACNDINWTILQILKSQIFGIVVIYAKQFDVNQLRRIQLASEKAGSATIWLSPTAEAMWPISMQIEVTKSIDGIQANILRQRF